MNPNKTFQPMSMGSRNSRKLFRFGTTSIEVIVGCVLMTAALVTVGIFQTRITKSESTLRQAALARTEVRNAREVVGSWPLEMVTDASVSQIQISPGVQATLPDARWIAKVFETEQPVRGKRVFLDLEWSRNEQIHSTSGITFWVTAEESSP